MSLFANRVAQPEGARQPLPDSCVDQARAYYR
jgi:hypothetical protein